MRRLLIASQKGGVGKTTTAINLATVLARAGQRVVLVDADPAQSVPASLGLIQSKKKLAIKTPEYGHIATLYDQPRPNLDVLVPRDEGPAAEGNLDALLAALLADQLPRRYDFLVVDSPPFLGSLPLLLLHACEDLLLVLRLEPLGYRTLPAYLEVFREARQVVPNLRFRGVLLTLPRGAISGSPWEVELRGDLGPAILPLTIPYDTLVGESLLQGRVVVDAFPDSPAARQYGVLAELLGLLPPGTNHG